MKCYSTLGEKLLRAGKFANFGKFLFAKVSTPKVVDLFTTLLLKSVKSKQKYIKTVLLVLLLK